MPLPSLAALFSVFVPGLRPGLERRREGLARRSGRYIPERVFLGAVLALSVGGFWNLYLGGGSPHAIHHLHATTSFAWLVLLLVQTTLVAGNRYRHHRTLGMVVLLLGPLLVATSALLTVHSARRGIASGDGDALIVQNVMVTLELAALIVLGFALKRNRQLHGACLQATAVLFMGIALFFTLTSLVPGFRIEGPGTFHRFALAASVGEYVSVGAGILFFTRHGRNGWPWLLAGAAFLLNGVVQQWLEQGDLIQPLTAAVAAINQTAAFVVAFAVMLVLLTADVLRRGYSKPSAHGGISVRPPVQ